MQLIYIDAAADVYLHTTEAKPRLLFSTRQYLHDPLSLASQAVLVGHLEVIMSKLQL